MSVKATTPIVMLIAQAKARRAAGKLARKHDSGSAAREEPAPSHEGGDSKTVRDTFKLPAGDYDLIRAMKRRAKSAGIEIGKSELLGAGLRMLAALDDEAFRNAIATKASSH